MFKKEPKEYTLEDEYNDNVELSIKELIRFKRKLYGKEFHIDEKDERQKYLESITLVINVIDALIEKNNLSLETLYKILPVNAKFLMLRPQFPDLIYVKNEQCSAHFHLRNGIIYDAENLQVLPNLDRNLRTERINSFFQGMTIFEARALLKQMNILPVDNEIDKMIATHDESTIITESFHRNIITRILLAQDETSVYKAMLVANAFECSYDFTRYTEKGKQLKKVK